MRQCYAHSRHRSARDTGCSRRRQTKQAGPRQRLRPGLLTGQGVGRMLQAGLPRLRSLRFQRLESQSLRLEQFVLSQHQAMQLPRRHAMAVHISLTLSEN
jgi:hypothetical protein